MSFQSQLGTRLTRMAAAQNGIALGLSKCSDIKMRLVEELADLALATMRWGLVFLSPGSGADVGTHRSEVAEVLAVLVAELIEGVLDALRVELCQSRAPNVILGDS